ncbi:MAG TPA: hypothetical protein VFU21_22265 [Kofleriaceae bacterium]|nr:hypothetical protein [Kofleriaceae bacterium]
MARSASASMRAEKVIEHGLGLYSQGDLVGALKRWRHALEIDPDNRRAHEYVTYVEEHYDLLARKLRGEGPPLEGEEPGPTIEMEAEDPMEEIDAYDSVEVSIAEVDPVPRTDTVDAGSPTEEMKPQKLVVKPDTLDEDEGDITGEEATKAEGLVGRRLAVRASGVQASATAAAPRPVVITEESIDEGWSLDDLEDTEGAREDVDTLELAAQPGYLDDLSDLGARDDDEPASAIARPSDDSTGELTKPERRPRPDSGRQRNTERSTPPPMPDSAGLARGRGSTAPPPVVKPAEPRSEFDLADFDDPDPPALGPAGAAVAVPGPEDGAEVRVTFRSPRDSEVRAAAPPPAVAAKPASDRPPTEEEATVDRLRPPLSPLSGVSFDDETYERPSLSILAEAAAAGDLDSLDGDAADSDDLRLERRPGSEGDTGAGDSSERETTQLYRRDRRLSKGAASMELIAAELEADLDEAVSMDPSLGEDAVKARVGWLINRARTENHAGHFPIAVVAIDLALEQYPDSAVAQKLIYSNREILYEVYRSFLGDMHAVPSLAMPMDKIPMHELDHRAAFLLSRIDGALTLEDVLDVSGMARLEAFRHLCRLLLRGILEIRS